MSKKILVLTGSPNREGNSSKMADAFIRGAKAAGHTITKYETAHKNLRGFTASGEPDDFSELVPLLNSYDVLVIATPLYWFSFPAQIKAVIDQLDSSTDSKMTIAESYLFVSGGETEDAIYAPIISLYHMIREYPGWKDRGVLKIGGADEVGAIEKSGILEQAEKMGREV